jgi:serine/threonine protein kinase
MHMPPASLCPAEDELRSFLLGAVSEDAAQRLEQHLTQCPSCLQRLNTLPAEDALCHDLRRETATPRPAHPLLEQLKQRLRALPEQAGSVWEATQHGSDPGRAIAPPAGEATERIDALLAPARGPGEIGWLGDYRILKHLGSGGMGTVFEAEDVRLKRRVAIKVMRAELAAMPAARQRFLREAQTAAALAHENIVTIHHVEEAGGVPFFIMPLLQGESLADRLKRTGKLPVAEVLRIGREVAEGLAAAHAAGLIHRDIKPGNIWLEFSRDPQGSAGALRDASRLNQSGRVKILDFGLARSAAGDVQLTQIGAVLGTPAYMAPEQARSMPVDHRCDLFSLGCVLYHLATGQTPFRGVDTMSILLALAQDQPKPPHQRNPEMPPALSDLILKLLAKDPAGRPGSARAVADALEAIERRMHLPGVPTSRRARPRRLLIAAAAAVLLLGIALAGQIVLRITSKDGKVREVPLNPGDKIEVVQAEQGSGTAKPFVLRRPGGAARAAFAQPADALDALRDGEEIAIHGNGPFAFRKIQLRDKGLSLRAAPGFRPVIVAREDDLGPAPAAWITLEKTSLVLEGCDVRCPADRTAFAGGGASWEFRNCRLLGPPTRPAQNIAGSRLLTYSGPRLRLVDCLVAQEAGTVLHIGPKSTVELNNNIFFMGAIRFGDAPSRLLELESPGGQRLHLEHNTYSAKDCRLVTLAFAKDAGAEPADAEATYNRLHWGGAPLVALAAAEGGKSIRDCLRWRGRGNFYTAQGEYLAEPPTTGLAAWTKLWGQNEEASEEAPGLIPQHESLPKTAWVDVLKPLVERLRRQGGARLGEFGPDWKLLGAGAGYVEALAASGRAVPRERLCPRPEAGGPVVLLRAGRPVRGYQQLADAFEAAVDGDTIELRTETPLAACPIASPRDGMRRLLLRGAPGYRPVVTGKLFLDRGNELSVENLHFSAGGIAGATPGPGMEARLERLANCTFDGSYNLERVDALCRSPTGAAAEIVNCVIVVQSWPPPLRAVLAPGEKLLVRNCVIDGPLAVAVSADDGRGQVTLDRCVVWSPGAACLLSLKGHPSIQAQATLFEGGDALALTLGADLSGWHGARNVYRIGHHAWLIPRDRWTAGLAAWRQRWDSPEDGSLESEPLVYEAASWRLRSHSPGHQAAPDGTDIGAEVRRVARTTPPDQP